MTAIWCGTSCRCISEKNRQAVWGVTKHLGTLNPPHTDQYLNWDSHHSIFANYSVVNTLKYRVQTSCSDQQLHEEEQLHIRTALNRCNYLGWVFHRFQTKLDYQLSCQDHGSNSNMNKHMDNKTKNIFTVVPFSRELSESFFKNVCGKVGVQVHFKGSNTTEDLLVVSKDKDSITINGGIIEYIDTSVTIWGAQWSTLPRWVGPVGIDTRNI